MLRTVFGKSLYDQRRALAGWGIGVVLLVLIESALWPSVSDMPDLGKFLANYPEAMRELFNIEQFGTGAGFLNVELFSAVLPIVFIIFGIGRGARAVAGEEEAGTLELLLVTRVSPTSLVLQKAGALVVSTAGLGLVLYLSTLVFSAAFGLDVGPGDLAGATLAMVLLGVEFGGLALAVSAASGRHGLSLAIASALAVAAYVLYAAGKIVDVLEPWSPLSPFQQALADGPLGAGLPASYLWLIVVPVLAVAVALPIFDRRDIGTHN